MAMDQSAQHSEHRLKQLAGEFAGWRIGLGGSGHWWAVRGNDLIRTPDVEELTTRLREEGAEKIAGNLVENPEIRRNT